MMRPFPDDPTALRPRVLVAMAHVVDVSRSIAFYEALGFVVDNTFVPPGAPGPSWAWLQCGGAKLMVAKADAPVVPEQQAVLFYIYYDDVPAAKAAMDKKGVATGPINYPFYCPKGEFRVTDPDGYCLMIAHT